VIRIVRGDARGDTAYRGFGRRVQETEVKVERIAGKRQHIAQLTAAENPDRHFRFPLMPAAFNSPRTWRGQESQVLSSFGSNGTCARLRESQDIYCRGRPRQAAQR